MSLATALLTPILGDASPWTPRRLFQLGEAGGVYDPSDLTAEKVAWRRNLLTWTEQFDNAAWTKTNGTITANTDTAPDGTLTADTFAATSANAVLQLDPARSGRMVNSVWLKRKTGTGAVQLLTPAGVYVAVTLTSNWTRFEATAEATLSLFRVRVTTSGDEVYVWGAQAEVGTTASAYQRITDFTSDFLAAFPTHGLYQDAAGTTPVTALGQPVGLVIDSKTGGLANVGPELVSNGEFTSGTTGWTLTGGGTFTASGGVARLQNPTTPLAEATVYATTATVIGRSYLFVFTLVGSSAGQTLSVRVGTAAGGTQNAVRSATVAGKYQVIFTATATTTFITLNQNINTANAWSDWDNISVREVPGVHAIQATSSSRPLLDGRVNQFERSEQLNNAYWTRLGMTITENTSDVTDPLGGNTAAKAQVAANERQFSGPNQIAPFIVGSTATWSIWARKGNVAAWPFRVSALGSVTASYNATFDFDTGVFSGVTSGLTATPEVIGGGWYRLLFTLTVPASTTNVTMQWRAYLNSATGVGDIAYFWRPSAVFATDAAYPYQRVAAATDYADVGVPRSFLFDGFDDSLYTASNMDLSGTDKVTVLAGVRKLSDAAQGVVVEFTSTVVNPGAFALFAPQGVGSPDNGMRVEAVTAFSANAAPATIVQTGLANRGAPSLAYRVNGTVTASSTSSLGSGNFANSVLNIGRRNNVSTPFNGKAYQLIVRGALTDAATLAQAERYVGAKTGLYL